MAITLPAPVGTIYTVDLNAGAFTSPGRPPVPLTGDSPPDAPFLVDRGNLVDFGQKLRI